MVQLGAFENARIAKFEWLWISRRFEFYFDGKLCVVAQLIELCTRSINPAVTAICIGRTVINHLARIIILFSYLASKVMRSLMRFSQAIFMTIFFWPVVLKAKKKSNSPSILNQLEQQS